MNEVTYRQNIEEKKLSEGRFSKGIKSKGELMKKTGKENLMKTSNTRAVCI